MDPDANLEALLERAHTIAGNPTKDDVANELAELVLALDEWLAKGGGLPEAWTKLSFSNGVTIAQGITLASKVVAGDTMHVTQGGMGLNADYLAVHYTNDPFVLGIDRTGRASS